MEVSIADRMPYDGNRWKIARVAASAAVVVLAVCAVVMLPGGVRKIGLGMQVLRLGGMDGSGDKSAFLPAGWGMDARTAVDDDETITSSLWDSDKPKPKPKWNSSEVVGKDGQTYAEIPPDIIARFKEAETEPSAPSANAPSVEAEQEIAASAAIATATAPQASPQSQPDDHPPAWVVAEAQALQKEAAAQHKVQSVTLAHTTAVQRVLKGTPATDAYAEYESEYLASLQKSSNSNGASSTASPSAGGNKNAETSENGAGASTQTSPEIASLKHEMQQMTDENQEKQNALMKTLKLLTNAVEELKNKASGGAGAAQSPSTSSETASTSASTLSSTTPKLRWGEGRGAPVAEEPESVRRAEWDALKARVEAQHKAVAAAATRGRVAEAPATTTAMNAHSKLSYFGRLRQEKAERMLHSMPPPATHAEQGGLKEGPMALGDNDDLRVGFRQQEEADEQAGRQGREVKEVGEDKRSKLSFWAQARDERASMAHAAALGRVAAYASRTRSRTTADKQLMLPAVAAAARGGREGIQEEDKETAKAAAPTARGARCVAAGCTCVPHGNRAVSAAGVPLGLTQLHGDGAQANCMYYSVQGPTGHTLSVRLKGSDERSDSPRNSWTNYGSVSTGCLAASTLATTPSFLDVTDTITGDSASFALLCSS